MVALSQVSLSTRVNYFFQNNFYKLKNIYQKKVMFRLYSLSNSPLGKSCLGETEITIEQLILRPKISLILGIPVFFFLGLD